MRLASFRLRCWHFHQELLRRGVSSVIYGGGKVPAADVVIFQKSYSKSHLKLARNLKERGVTILYNLSDIVPAGTDIFAGTAQLLSICNRVIVNGRVLGQFFVERHNPNWVVVDDPYEWILPPDRHAEGGARPRVFWHGSSKNYRHFVSPIRTALRFDLESLTELTEPKWDASLFPDYVRPFEIGFAPLPLKNPYVLGKSSNKVVGFMALGLAVIASDHPSYREVITHGETGFLGITTEDFNAAYDSLRDPPTRQRIAEAGYQSVVDRFSISSLTDRLLSVFQKGEGTDNGTTGE
jgi:glycosyltransferase involved in cell wall biosynthesis